VNFGLVIVGDEILSGKREDKHLPRVIQLLGARGLALAWARYVGDDRPRLTGVLAEALGGGDVVLCCGGIGATPDDHTRQAAAAALGVPLELHPQARELILERMRDVAREQGTAFEPDRPDNVHRLNMGVFPRGASLIPNPYNKIPGFTVGRLHCVPGFPVMAHPMIEWLLDTLYADAHGAHAVVERSLIVYGAMEAALTPLMEAVEAAHPALRVFSLPSVDHPLHGKHIELGVKGPAALVEPGYTALRAGLVALGVPLGPEMVR
jgi:molybdopterin-biosynthesis enzyme MoeA-like protein